MTDIVLYQVDIQMGWRGANSDGYRDYAVSGNSIRLNFGDDTPINFSASSVV